MEVLKTEYKNLDDATQCIRIAIRTAIRSFVNIGYALKCVKDKNLYQQNGYIDIWEYGKSEFGLSKSAISRYISICERFSVNGNSMTLREEYKNYGLSKLQELLTLTDEEIEESGITETTTIAKIREVKKELKDDEEVDEDIPGQFKVTDYIPDPNEKEEKETENVVATSQIKVPHYKLYKAIAIEIVSLMYEDNGKSTIDEIMKDTDSCMEYLEECFSDEEECYVEYEDVLYEFFIKNGELTVHETDEKGKRTGKQFSEITGPLITLIFNEYHRRKSEEIVENTTEDTKQDQEPIKAAVETKEENSKKTSTEKGCDGHCFYCTEDDCNCKQEKRENCIYDMNAKCSIYGAHEVALNNGIDCKDTCCMNCQKDCGARCQTSTKSRAQNEKARETISEVVTADIIAPVQIEPTVIVNRNTKGQQTPVPRLSNNEKRKEWIDNYQEWPLWIDNHETDEKFYRYEFDNGDCFVVRTALSKRGYYNWKTGKYESSEGNWSHKKYYIIKKDSNFSFSDSETNESTMVEHLKKIQRGDK